MRNAYATRPRHRRAAVRCTAPPLAAPARAAYYARARSTPGVCQSCEMFPVPPPMCRARARCPPPLRRPCARCPGLCRLFRPPAPCASLGVSQASEKFLGMPLIRPARTRHPPLLRRPSGRRPAPAAHRVPVRPRWAGSCCALLQSFFLGCSPGAAHAPAARCCCADQPPPSIVYPCMLYTHLVDTVR
jgi:hypothetical protein